MITFEPPYFIGAAVVGQVLFVGASLLGMFRSVFNLEVGLVGRWLLVLLPSVLGIVTIFLLMDQVNLGVGTP